MARLYPQLVDLGRTSTASVDARGTREVLVLPGGPARPRARHRAAPRTLRVDARPAHRRRRDQRVLLSSGSDSRTVAAAYAELALPIAPTLEASLAARWDRYSDFGSTVNPKLGLKWKATGNVALRATYTTAFRAPSLSETSQGHVAAFLSCAIR
jgi:iron complex outermembrane receptor protein